MEVIFRADSLGSEFLIKAVYESTARQRTPVTLQSCHQAVAWDLCWKTGVWTCDKASENHLGSERELFQTAAKHLVWSKHFPFLLL